MLVEPTLDPSKWTKHNPHEVHVHQLSVKSEFIGPLDRLCTGPNELLTIKLLGQVEMIEITAVAYF